MNLRRRPPLGHSPTSLSLGARDPRRTHRNPQGLTSLISKQSPIDVQDGQLGVSMMPALDEDTATTAELIRALKENSLMER